MAIPGGVDEPSSVVEAKVEDNNDLTLEDHAALGSSECSTKSLKEGDLEEVIENGRRYCNNSYFMPNDLDEQTRLSVLHQVHLLILANKLTRASLSANITRVLDIGTGTSEWAIAMGEQYPSAEIIATDISVFQLGDLPSNVTLEIDDIEDEWTFPQNSFDFIHLRDMSGSISDWKSVYREAFKCLVPGGQIEISDFGDTSTSNSSNLFQAIYSSEIQSASEVAGTPLGVKHLERNIFEDIGYVEIRNVMIRVPLGMWPSDANRKTVGKLMLIGTLEGLEAKSLRLLTKCKGWSAEDVTELCTKVKAEMLADQSLHSEAVLLFNLIYVYSSSPC